MRRLSQVPEPTVTSAAAPARRSKCLPAIRHPGGSEQGNRPRPVKAAPQSAHRRPASATGIRSKTKWPRSWTNWAGRRIEDKKLVNHAQASRLGRPGLQPCVPSCAGWPGLHLAAGDFRRLRRRRQPDGTRRSAGHPADGAVPGALDPDHGDKLHPHRRGAVTACALPSACRPHRPTW